MNHLMLHVDAGQATPVYDFGIESLQSHEFSVGIFIFLIISILVFVGIMIAFMKPRSGHPLKKGEWVLMGFIFLGVIVASVIGALQLLEGYLF